MFPLYKWSLLCYITYPTCISTFAYLNKLLQGKEERITVFILFNYVATLYTNLQWSAVIYFVKTVVILLFFSLQVSALFIRAAHLLQIASHLFFYPWFYFLIKATCWPHFESDLLAQLFLTRNGFSFAPKLCFLPLREHSTLWGRRGPCPLL